MPLYRKKPVVIEAKQFVPERSAAISVWLDAHNVPHLIHAGGSSIGINTLEGVMTANPGDWIIKGVQGEFYPCRADIFAQTYEAVGEVSDE